VYACMCVCTCVRVYVCEVTVESREFKYLLRVRMALLYFNILYVSIADKPLKELRKMYFKLKDKIFAKCWNGAIPYSNTEALEEILKETFGEDQKLGSKEYPR